MPGLRANCNVALIGFLGLVAVVALFLLNRVVVVNALTVHETASNIALTQLLSNTLWPEYASLVATASKDDTKPGASRPREKALQLSRVLRGMTRGTHVLRVKLYDLGGDEFTVVPGGMVSPVDVERLASRVVESFAQIIVLDEHEIIITPSIGIGVCRHAGADADALVRRACAALCTAKQEGGNRYRWYAPEMRHTALQQLGLHADLKHALERDEFDLYYQPRVHAGTLQVVGAEALLRWRHPRRGPVLPDQFIPALEDMGLIDSVGTWVLRTACVQSKAWQEAGLRPVRVSVNISPSQFVADAFVQTVEQILRETGRSPACLELELTESVLLDDPHEAVRIIEALNGIGVSIAIDDFGTGYSSLKHLKLLPIDYLKIDRTFVRELASNRTDEAIVKTISALAQSLGITLVAEGVENEEQVRCLRGDNCAELQGHLFSRAVPCDRMAGILSDSVLHEAI